MKASKFLFVFLIVFLLFQLLPIWNISFVHASTGWFGNNTLGPSATTIENTIKGSLFTATETGSANNITVALKYATTQSTWNIKCAIYKHSDLSFVGGTEERAIMPPASLDWYTFDFVTEPSLIASTDYILVAWSNTASGLCQIGYKTGATNQAHWCTATYGTWPSPLVPNHDTNNFSIYCTYTPVLSPTYSNVSSSDFQSGMPCTFNATWTANAGNMSHYKFESNNTGSLVNTTYAFPSGLSTAYSNVTLTLNSTIYQMIAWRVWANNTATGSNQTDWQYLTTFPKTPPMQRTAMGYTRVGGRNSLYVKDAVVPAIYCVWLNTSTVKYQVAAYDLGNKNWTNPIDIASAASADGHWQPSINILYNGSLVIFYAHTSPLKYRMTTNNASSNSNLNTIIGTWTTEQTVPATPSLTSYPDPIALNNGQTLVLWFRGVQFDEWHIKNLTSSGWGTSRCVINGSMWATHIYMSNQLKINETSIAWSGRVYHDYSPVGYQDVYFFYTADSGNTFRKYNGTAINIGIWGANETQILVYDTSVNIYGCYPPAIDKTGNLYVEVFDSASSIAQICYYNSTLGTTNGIWTIHNITRASDGEPLKQVLLESVNLYYDTYYQKISMWLTDLNDLPVEEDEYQAGYLSKFVQDPWDKFKFHIVYTNTTDPARGGYEWRRILENPRAYEIYGLETRDRIVGNQTKGDNSENIKDEGRDTIWACKFTAERNQTITALYVRIQWVGGAILFGKVAVYDASFNKLSGSDSTDAVGGSTSAWNKWSMIALPAIKIYAGTIYWLCFQFDVEGIGADCYTYYFTGSTNQTFIDTSDYDDSFPNTLSPDTYYDRKMSVFAISQLLVVCGLGVTPLWIGANEWTNTTATVYDLGYSLEELCATLQYEGFDVWITVKDNGTVYQYNYGHLPNSTVLMLSTTDEIRIYSYTSGYWHYDYFHFNYLSIISQPSTLSWQTLLKSYMKTLFSMSESFDWFLQPKGNFHLLTVLTQSFIWESIATLLFSISLSLASSLGWTLFSLTNYNLILNFTPTLSWTILSQTIFHLALTLSQGFSWLINVLALRILYVTLSFTTPFTWQTFIQSTFHIITSFAINPLWTLLSQTQYHILFALTTPLTWLLTALKSAGTFFVNLTWTTTHTFTFLTETFYHILTTLSTNPSWTLLSQTAYHILTSFATTTTWILTILVGAGNIVTLALTTATTWLMNVTHIIPEEAELAVGIIILAIIGSLVLIPAAILVLFSLIKKKH